MEFKDNEHIQNLTAILKRVGERVEGNLICDIDPDYWTYDRNREKIHNLQHLVRNKQKIIEIGINACHSLVLMLLENPTAEYLLFDLNNHRYTEPALEYVRRAFPLAKITAVFGDSVRTIPQYIAEHNEEWNTYDLCHLDGGHTEDVFAHDFINVQTLVMKDTCIIFDDYDLPAIHRFINKKLTEDVIEEYKEPGLQKTPFHFLYRYN